MTVLENFKVPGSTRKAGDLYLTIKDGWISDYSVYPPIEEVSRIDCKGAYISPGLVDLQVNGGGGYIFAENLTAASLNQIDACHLKHGTTRYLITLYSKDFKTIKRAIDLVKTSIEKGEIGCIGIHLEGPFINPEKRGAHDAKYIQKPSIEAIKEILSYGKEVIKLWTIAPEVCSDEVLDYLIQTGITLSVGHSNATVSEANQAFKKGIRCATHLYNTMSGLHHRQPGVVGAILNDNRINTTIIADGVHVDYTALGIAYQLKKDKLMLVSDATFLDAPAEGLSLNGLNIEKKLDGYYTADGKLAGGFTPLLGLVQNMVRYVKVSIPEALTMASRKPAEMVRTFDYGHLAVGKKADLLLLDGKLNIRAIMRDGEWTKTL